MLRLPRCSRGLAWAVWPPAPLPAQTTLKDAYRTFFGSASRQPGAVYRVDARGAAIVQEQFNSITPRTSEVGDVHPKRGATTSVARNQYVAFGESSHMFIIAMPGLAQPDSEVGI